MHEHEGGKKYFVNIEGTEYPWERDTITTAEIRTLGNLPANLPVVEEFPDGTERTLAENETVELKPGHRYGRASKFKRG
jgi:hypothetical protein